VVREAGAEFGELAGAGGCGVGARTAVLGGRHLFVDDRELVVQNGVWV
jgi:hypothetical protein